MASSNFDDVLHRIREHLASLRQRLIAAHLSVTHNQLATKSRATTREPRTLCLTMDGQDHFWGFYDRPPLSNHIEFSRPDIHVALSGRFVKNNIIDTYAYLYPRRGFRTSKNLRDKISEVLAGSCQPIWCNQLPSISAMNTARQYRERRDPLIIGLSISHAASKTFAGSIGFFCRKNPEKQTGSSIISSGEPVKSPDVTRSEQDILYLGSAGHILLNNGQYTRGVAQQIRQPGRVHDKGNLGVPIGVIQEPSFFPMKDATIPTDAAIALVDYPNVDATFFDETRPLVGPVEVENNSLYFDLAVSKRGAGTGYTNGTTLGIIDRQPFFIDENYSLGYIEDLILIEGDGENFSSEGDSGSLVVHEDKNGGAFALGMVVGGLDEDFTPKGTGGYTFCTPVWNIEKHLGVKIEYASQRGPK